MKIALLISDYGWGGHDIHDVFADVPAAQEGATEVRHYDYNSKSEERRRAERDNVPPDVYDDNGWRIEDGDHWLGDLRIIEMEVRS